MEKEINIKEVKKEEIDYSFIKKILLDKIGILIDEFLILNMGNKINKFISDSFTRWAINSINETEKEIIQEIEKIIKKK